MGHSHPMRKPPKYIQQFIDQDGKARFYFRRAGYKSVALPGLPWSPTFMAVYEEAVKQSPLGTPQKFSPPIGVKKTKPGTINAVLIGFYASTEFRDWSPETQRTRRNILERFRDAHGDKAIATLQPRHVADLVAAKSETPAAARNFKKTLSALMRFAVTQGFRNDNPVIGVAAPKIKGNGFQTWNEEQIAAFEAHHPIGSRARLAFGLLLYTAPAARRCDPDGATAPSSGSIGGSAE